MPPQGSERSSAAAKARECSQACRSLTLSFAFPLLQDQPDAMQVGRQHRQGNRTREAVRTMAANSVESPMLQPIDGRLDRRMRTPRGNKRLLLFPFPVGS